MSRSKINVHKKLCLLIGVTVILHAGCSTSEYSFAPVSGKILLDESPLVGASVVFAPIGSTEHPEPGPVSSGITDDQGNFTLVATNGQKGAVIGPHRVGIRMPEDSELAGQNKVDEVMSKARANGTLHELTPDRIEEIRQSAINEVFQLPEIYNDESQLRFEVKSNQNEAKFELTSDPN